MATSQEQFRLARQIAEDNSWFEHAFDEINKTYGDDIRNKHKSLSKFGENMSVGTTEAALMTLPSGILTETMLTGNGITHISSSNAGDVGPVAIEGHTISGFDLSFVVQTATLNGQNKVVLTTPLARSTNLKNVGADNWLGDIYCYEDDTVSGGIPDTDEKVHIIGPAVDNHSLKVGTSISSQDYWLLTGMHLSVNEKSSASAVVRLCVGGPGRVFSTLRKYGASSTGANVDVQFRPYLIIPPNSDVFAIASANQQNKAVSAGIDGLLAVVTNEVQSF